MIFRALQPRHLPARHSRGASESQTRAVQCSAGEPLPKRTKSKPNKRESGEETESRPLRCPRVKFSAQVTSESVLYHAACVGEALRMAEEEQSLRTTRGRAPPSGGRRSEKSALLLLRGERAPAAPSGKMFCKYAAHRVACACRAAVGSGGNVCRNSLPRRRARRLCHAMAT